MAATSHSRQPVAFLSHGLLGRDVGNGGGPASQTIENADFGRPAEQARDHTGEKLEET